jgi:hypothetical protein
MNSNSDLVSLTLKAVIRDMEFKDAAQTISDAVKDDIKLKYMLEYYLYPKYSHTPYDYKHYSLLSKSESDIVMEIIKETVDIDRIKGVGCTGFDFIKNGYYIEINHWDPEKYHEHTIMYKHGEEKTEHKLASFRCLNCLNTEDKILEVLAISKAINNLTLSFDTN